MFLNLPTDIFIGLFNFLLPKDISTLDISITNKKLRSNLYEIYNYISMEGDIFNKSFVMFIKKREISINQLYIKNPNMSTLILYMNHFEQYFKYISFKKIRKLTIELNNPKGITKILYLFSEIFSKIKYLKIIIHRTCNINDLCMYFSYKYKHLKKLEIINFDFDNQYMNLPILYYPEIKETNLSKQYNFSKKLEEIILSGFIIFNKDIVLYDRLVEFGNIKILKLKIYPYNIKTINLAFISEYLEHLTLYDCYINFLDDDFPNINFPNLKYLDISINRISKIPSLIFKMPNLEILKVGNKVKQISKEFIKDFIYEEEYFSASRGLVLNYYKKGKLLEVETKSNICRVTFNNFDFICI